MRKDRHYALAALAFGVALGLTFLARAQIPPPVSTTPGNNTLAVPVALVPYSNGLSGADGGAASTVPTFSTEQLSYICCGTTATAFGPALAGRTGIFVQNAGPNQVCVSGNAAVNLQTNCGTMLKGGSPYGDSMTANAAASDAQFCIAATAGQTDAGGCLIVKETK